MAENQLPLQKSSLQNYVQFLLLQPGLPGTIAKSMLDLCSFTCSLKYEEYIRFSEFAVYDIVSGAGCCQSSLRTLDAFSNIHTKLTE